jgi:hypothetical protein
MVMTIRNVSSFDARVTSGGNGVVVECRAGPVCVDGLLDPG